MSFEGYQEYICQKGHHYNENCYSLVTDCCPICSSKPKYTHLVDETNGYDPEDPSTFSAGIKVVGFEDEWHKDHYGNKYATKIDLAEPCADEWRKIE